MLQQLFLSQVSQYAASPVVAGTLWAEMQTAYTAPDRFFHTLSHLQQVLQELLPLKAAVADWDTLFFSLCYHDVVYDVSQNVVAFDNEERSAAFAEKRLQSIGYPPEKTQQCKEQILATQKHRLTDSADTNFFLDADISILGQPWEVYLAYKINIRKEYHVYPDTIFYAGRKKMVEHFLRMDTVFKTAHFQQLYEEKAKANLRKEYRLLQA